jgi:hypothetical protein
VKRRIGAFVAASLLTAGLAVGTSVGPASAAACVSQGVATLSKSIYLVGLRPQTLAVGFSISAKCANGGSGSSTGTLNKAACGLSNGTGTVNGKPFKVQTAASLLIIQQRLGSGVSGVGNAVSDARRANNSCTTGARYFLVTVALNGV